MKLLLRSSRRFFRRHPGQLVLSLIGIAAGVAVVTGVALIHGVLVDSLDSASDALTPDQRLRIESRHGRLDEAVYADLATSRGAPQLIPVLSARVRVNGQPLELIGIDPFSLTSADTIGVAAAGPLLQSAQQVLVTETTLGRLGLSPDEPLRVKSTGNGTSSRLVRRWARGPDLTSVSSWTLPPSSICSSAPVNCRGSMRPSMLRSGCAPD